ncbi:hypothetical protein SCUCBS95973_001156 [Sporothrix curviconia]|uniref:Defects in morphology protein 1 n=1 Tax=Sporothrix curviconia TaxID=1260050 RepID=A0ABP0AWP3_9PEZI
MPVAGSDSIGGGAHAAVGANTGNFDAGIDIDIDVDEFGSDIDLDDDDKDSDYGWDLSLDEDALELLDSAAAPASEPAEPPSIRASLPSSRTRILVPIVPENESAERNAVLSQSLGGPLLAPGGTGVTLPHCDPVADDDDPSAAAVLDAAVLGFEANYPDLSQIVAELTGEISSDDDSASKTSKNTSSSEADNSSDDDDFISKDGKYTAKPGVVPSEAEAAATATAFVPPAHIRTRRHDPRHKSPIALFRTAPKKPLSVSDLVAGAWCELQYEYTLTRLPGGRPTRTAAMKAGTKLHKTLEDQVHTVVPIATTIKEDLVAVRIFNMIQGLSTLRETGLTREFDVWGVVDTGHGADDVRYQVVNGVIDALSYENPDPGAVGFSSRMPTIEDPDSKSAATSFSTVATTSFGSQITDYFPSSPLGPSPPAQNSLDEYAMAAAAYNDSRKIYVSDVKTRESLKLPTPAAARPAKMQLMLYHRFLSDLAAGRLSFARVFRRFGVNPLQPLSPSFLAELTADEVQGNYQVPIATDLQGFVDLLHAEVAQTFPRGADSIGDIVAIEYRQRASNDKAQHHGRCLGTIVVPVDRPLLDRYLANYLGWWRGVRPAVGVDIEDAGFKCRYCEFAGDCDWRLRMDEERMAKARAKVAAERAARLAKTAKTAKAAKSA